MRTELYKKYNGKKLGVDEYSVAMNEIKEVINDLENVNILTGEDHLLLKWGTLKSWDFHSEKGKELLKEYFELGSSMSAIAQKDSARQKEIICELIDECDGVIQEDWGGKYLTRDEAKKYVLEYGK